MSAAQYLLSVTVTGVGAVNVVGTFNGQPRSFTQTDKGMTAGYFDAGTTVNISVAQGTLLDWTLDGADEGVSLPRDIIMDKAHYVKVTLAVAPPVPQCQTQYGDWGIFNFIRDFICWVQGISTS